MKAFSDQFNGKIPKKVKAVKYNKTKQFLKDKDGKLDKKGAEVLDPTPMELPVGFRRPTTDIQEVIATQLKEAMTQQALNNGQETFEEANDFSFDDEDTINSPWEYSADNEADPWSKFVEDSTTEEGQVKEAEGDTQKSPEADKEES